MVNSRNLSDLHLPITRGALELKRRMKEQGYDMLITCTYRDGAAQNMLYSQGRTKPGRIVTNAKAGQSIHNYRLAFDICENIRGREYANAQFFDAAGKIWTEMGGEWGGSWKSFPDRPHFQFTGGLTLKDLQKGKQLPPDTRMKWEPKPVMAPENWDLLCKLAHHEARGEDEKGIMLVVYVVLNRVAAKGFPGSVVGVVYQPNQFAPVKKPDFENTIPTLEVAAAVNKALTTEDTISQGALYFGSEADMEAPFFKNAIADGRIKKLFQHGGHIFLK